MTTTHGISGRTGTCVYVLTTGYQQYETTRRTGADRKSQKKWLGIKNVKVKKHLSLTRTWYLVRMYVLTGIKLSLRLPSDNVQHELQRLSLKTFLKEEIPGNKENICTRSTHSSYLCLLPLYASSTILHLLPLLPPPPQYVCALYVPFFLSRIQAPFPRHRRGSVIPPPTRNQINSLRLSSICKSVS